jgi:hypothetical protein
MRELRIWIVWCGKFTGRRERSGWQDLLRWFYGRQKKEIIVQRRR